MNPTFKHRCPATSRRRDERGRALAEYESCRLTQEWQVNGENACGGCGFVPSSDWRHEMAGKLGLQIEASAIAGDELEGAEADPPSTVGTARRGRPAKSAEAEA